MAPAPPSGPFSLSFMSICLCLGVAFGFGLFLGAFYMSSASFSSINDRECASAPMSVMSTAKQLQQLQRQKLHKNLHTEEEEQEQETDRVTNSDECEFDAGWARDQLQLLASMVSASAEFTGHINWDGMGHVGQYPVQHFSYFEYARQENVTQICEIGFNAGHSAIAYLAAKNTNKLLSFDMGDLKWSNHQYGFFKTVFGEDRFQVVSGDSMKTVPPFIESHVHWHGCDIVSIDGAHNDPWVRADFQNMIKLAKIGARFIFDDYDWDAVAATRKWAREQGYLVDEQCFDRSFVVGGYKKAWCTAFLAKK